VNRVFITGASGFIGASVARRLAEEGVPTAVLLRPMSNPWRLGDTVRDLTVIEGAFHEPAGYAAALADFAPDTVIHLAWHGVGRGHRDDPAHVRINVVGTVDLFHAAVQAGARSFITAGSQAEYGISSRRIDEGHPTQPITLYGAAKLATLTLLEQLSAVHAVRLAWLRVFSVYGPGDDEGTLISSLIRSLLAGERPAVTSGAQTWDYLHVDDAAAAFLAVARSGAAGVFNVGAGVAQPLHDTIVLVRDLIDPALEIGFGEVPLGPSAVMRLEPDVGRLRHATSWAPRIKLEDGLRTTIAWHRQRHSMEMAAPSSSTGRPAPAGSQFDAKVLRHHVLRMAYRGQSVHVACAFSIIEICAVLYSKFLRYNPRDPAWPDRDYLILSKGHGVMAIYACFYEIGWLGDADLDNYFKDGTHLRGLCESDVPGCEVTSGSLGHGLPIACGIAFGLKRKGSDRRVYCIVGDGEMNEGPMWEALLFATHQKLDNLVVIVDANQFQAMGRTEEVLGLEPLPAKLEAFGVRVVECDGHDPAALERALRSLTEPSGKPGAIVARTLKGQGVSFMAGDNRWHYTRLSDEIYARAMAELS